MRGLRRCRVDSGDVTCLELAQALGNAGLHAVEQGIEVHAAALAGETFLKARDATVAALFLAGPDSSFITGQTLVVDGGRQFI